VEVFVIISIDILILVFILVFILVTIIISLIIFIADNLTIYLGTRSTNRAVVCTT